MKITKQYLTKLIRESIDEAMPNWHHDGGQLAAARSEQDEYLQSEKTSAILQKIKEINSNAEFYIGEVKAEGKLKELAAAVAKVYEILLHERPQGAPSADISDD